ncbi:MAG: hypothetical protein ABEJ22_09245 [Haloferacaceae archaeon]
MVSAPSDDVEAADVAAADTVAWRADPDPRPRRLLRYAGVGLLGGVSLVALSLFA